MKAVGPSYRRSSTHLRVGEVDALHTDSNGLGEDICTSHEGGHWQCL